MKRIVGPDEFVAAFDSIVRTRESDVASLWEPWDAKGYTRLFLEPERGILQQVAGTLGLRYVTPYWTVDAVFYERPDTVHFPPDWNIAQFAAVALEHENDAKTSHYEANKLSLFNVPLKVLITYPNGPSDEDSLLTSYADILRASDVFNDFTSLRRQVVAFARKDGTISWRYFVYADDDFVPLEKLPP